MKSHRVVSSLTLLLAAQASLLLADSYAQVNLVTDTAALAAQYGTTQPPDPNLKNPWGVSFTATSPFWVSNADTNTSTLYDGLGTKNTMVTVTVPGAPTGQVANTAGTGNFVVNGAAASFIFDSLNGTITAWNGSLGTMGTAATVVPNTSGAVYTGLALANNGTGNYLYAANFTTGGGINVYDSNFTQVNSTTFAGKFVDPNAPSGYAPYNIQLIGNSLYVEYAQVGTTPGSAARGAGLGFVDVYDVNGNLQQHISDTHLNAPWGVAIAPASGFGAFDGDVLVGNFGNGEINAFNPTTGAYIGTLDDANGNPIVNANLWALDFRPAGAANSVGDALYFTAGINQQQDGLFGYIVDVPEPSAYALAAFGLAVLIGLVITRRQKARA